MDLTWLLFGFQGRINRGKYWLAILLYMVAWIIFGAVAVAWMGGIKLDSIFSIAGAAVGLWIAAMALIVAITWSSLATGIKRLHDRGKSGWWILLFWFGPSVLGSVQTARPDMGGAMLASLIGLVIAIWGFVELGCLRGTIGPNAFGPDPLLDNPTAVRQFSR